MSEMHYCYSCRVHHPAAEMRLYTTRKGKRWRCLRSIAAAHASQQARDAFGRQQSELNREQACRQASYRQPDPRLPQPEPRWLGEPRP